MHPVVRRYWIAFTVGLLVTGTAPLTGLLSPFASILQFATGAFVFALSQVFVLYRAGIVPAGTTPGQLRFLRFLAGLVGTPWLMVFLMLTLASWSWSLPRHAGP